MYRVTISTKRSLLLLRYNGLSAKQVKIRNKKLRRNKIKIKKHKTNCSDNDSE